MSDELKDQRIPIMMTPSEVKAIDDWMFANRIKSRAEAIRRLCQMGLSLDENANVIAENMIPILKSFQSFGTTERLDEISKMSYKQRVDLVTGLVSDLAERIDNLNGPLREIYSIARIYRNVKFDEFDQVPDKNMVKESLKLVAQKIAESKRQEQGMGSEQESLSKNDEKNDDK